MLPFNRFACHCFDPFRMGHRSLVGLRCDGVVHWFGSNPLKECVKDALNKLLNPKCRLEYPTVLRRNTMNDDLIHTQSEDKTY
jgi:hypothetical protein